MPDYTKCFQVVIPVYFPMSSRSIRVTVVSHSAVFDIVSLSKFSHADGYALISLWIVFVP